MQQPDPKMSSQQRRGFFADFSILVVFVFIIIGLGGFLVWASTIKIAQGITTTGQLTIESQRKTVQHLEGGIIEEILIADRQMVQEGDVLMILSNTAASNEANRLIDIIIARSFELQRIEAQVRGDSVFNPTRPQINAELSADRLNQAARVEFEVFNDMKASLTADIEVRNARIRRYQVEIDGFEMQLSTLENTIALERSEVARLEPLVADQLQQASTLTAAQRRLNNALDDQSRLTSNIDGKRASILETQEEIQQVQRRFIADIAPQRSTVRARLLEAQQMYTTNVDILNRREIVAPISGQILNLAYTTIGGVIGPGQPIMDIVPDDERLYIEARVSPIQIDSVRVGMPVTASFMSLDPVNPPQVATTVTTVDSDVTTNPDTGEQYFIARIGLPEDEIEQLKADGDFIAGIPVEIFADIGKDRTPLSRIVQPLSEVIEKGLRGE